MSRAPLRRLGLAAGSTALAVASFATVTQVHAAFVDTTAPRGEVTTGTVAVDGDAGSALLGVSDGEGGSSDASCLTLTSTGTLDSELRHFATTTGDLSPYLDVSVTKGTSTSPAGDCSGFTPDPVAYAAAGAGVLYDGPLSGLGTDWGSGTPDPAGPGGSNGLYADTAAGLAGRVASYRLGDPLVRDTFTAAQGTRVQSRTGDSGVSWSKHPGQVADGQTADAVITQEGRVRRDGGGGAWYVADAVPDGPDYAVEADLHVRSLLPEDEAVLTARTDPTAVTYYQFYYDLDDGEAVWRLQRVRGGTDFLRPPTASYDQTLQPGRTYRMRLEVQGATVTGLRRRPPGRAADRPRPADRDGTPRVRARVQLPRGRRRRRGPAPRRPHRRRRLDLDDLPRLRRHRARDLDERASRPDHRRAGRRRRPRVED